MVDARRLPDNSSPSSEPSRCTLPMEALPEHVAQEADRLVFLFCAQRPTHQSVACQGRDGFSEPLTNRGDCCGYSIFLKKILFIYLFPERGEGREKEMERNIDVWLFLVCP